jgi:hypothetical protein
MDLWDDAAFYDDEDEVDEDPETVDDGEAPQPESDPGSLDEEDDDQGDDTVRLDADEVKAALAMLRG